MSNQVSIPAGNDNPVTAGQGQIYNQGAGEPGFDRFGPIIDTDRFKKEYLFGIPLKAVLTGEVVTDDTLKQFIRKGISDFEASVRVPVNPVRIVDRFDFERADDLAFGTRRLTRWPVIKIENLKALWPGRNEALAPEGPTQEVDYPTSWVSLQGDQGLVRVIPNSGTLVNADANFLSSSAYRAVVLGGLKAWPNLWRITYIAGMDFDLIPDSVNDLIGILAAIKFLSQMGPAIFPVLSQNVSLDGMGQSTTTSGPTWLQLRIQELMAERDRMIEMLKTHYGTDIFFAAW
jgi:hypothetical protein